MTETTLYNRLVPGAKVLSGINGKLPATPPPKIHQGTLLITGLDGERWSPEVE